MAIELIGHGNCAQIVPISDYASAKQKYESTKPLRGRMPELRPLGRNRRYTWYEIDKNTYANQAENTQYDTYVCRLFSTDCVEFYPNGDITIRNTNWHSITTGAFINFVIWDIGRIVSASGKWYFRNKLGKSFRLRNELHLTREGGVFVSKDAPIQEYKRRVNRKALNAMRKKYHSIIEYGMNMLAIEPTFDRLELENAKIGLKNYNLLPTHNWAAPNANENRQKIFDLMEQQLQSGDLELLYDIARYIATNAGSYNYRTSKFECFPNRFKDIFDELFKYQFKDTVFVSEPVDVGVIFDDRNKKYFY